MVLVSMGATTHLEHEQMGAKGIAKHLFGQHLIGCAISYQTAAQASSLLT